MKKIVFLSIGALLLTATTQAQNVAYPASYIVAQNYFIKNTVPDGVKRYSKITTKEQFDKLFGMAATLDSQPTPISFANQFVIAAMDSTSSTTKELVPVSLVEDHGVLTFTYKRVLYDTPISYKTRVPLIIVADKRFVHDKVNIVLTNDKDISQTCLMDQYLNDPHIPKIAKDLYLGKAQWQDENQISNMFQKLSDPKVSAKPFYFRILSGSPRLPDNYNSGIDGATAEGMEADSYRFIKNHTQKFASFFQNKECFTDVDLKGWAGTAAIEILKNNWGKINSYNEYNQYVNSFCVQLRQNCKDCLVPEKETVSKFCNMVKEESIKYKNNFDVNQNSTKVSPPHPQLNRAN